MAHIIRLIGRAAKGFFILQGDIRGVLISQCLRSTPFTIFSGHILIHIKKHWKVLKSVEKCRFGRYHGNS